MDKRITRKYIHNGKEYDIDIFTYKDKKYTLELADDMHPCNYCCVKNECQNIIDEDLIMLCGCEFCNVPWYVVEYKEDDKV